MPAQQTKPVLFVYPAWDRNAQHVMAHVLTEDNEDGIDFDPYPGELPPERDAAKSVLSPLQEAWHEWWQANRDRYSAVVCFGGEAHDLVLGKGEAPVSRRGYPKLLDGVWVIPTLDPNTVATTGSGADGILFDLRLLQRVWSGEPVYETIPEDRLKIVDPDPKLRINRRKRLAGRVWMEEMYHRIARAEEAWDESQGPFAVVVDIETEGLDFWARRLWSVGFCWCEDESWAVNWDQLRHRDEERLWLREILHGFPIIMHHGQFDAPFLAHHLGCKTTAIKYQWDTELLSYLLDERSGIHGLKRLATDRFRAHDYGLEFDSGRNRKTVPWQDAWAVIDHMVEFELRTGLGRDTAEWGDELALAQRDHARKLIPDECNPPRRNPHDGPLVWSTKGVAIPEERWRRHVGPDGEPLSEENGGVYCDVQQERQKLLQYNAIDCWYTWRLFAPLLKAVEEDEQLPIYEHILRPASQHFARLKLDGMQVDLAEFRKAARGWCDRLRSSTAQTDRCSAPGSWHLAYALAARPSSRRRRPALC